MKIIAACKTHAAGIIFVAADEKNISYYSEVPSLGGGKNFSCVNVGPMDERRKSVYPRGSAIHMGSWWEDQKALFNCLTAAALNSDYPDEDVWFSQEKGLLPVNMEVGQWKI